MTAGSPVLRSMKGHMGRPLVGPESKMLGVRPPDSPMPDVQIGEDGFAIVEAAGLSIAPRVESLPPHLIPKRLGGRYPSARGSDQLSI